jgi:hypothetical protein
VREDGERERESTFKNRLTANAGASWTIIKISGCAQKDLLDRWFGFKIEECDRLTTFSFTLLSCQTTSSRAYCSPRTVVNGWNAKGGPKFGTGMLSSVRNIGTECEFMAMLWR